MTNELLAENKLLKQKCEAYEKAIEDIKAEIEEYKHRTLSMGIGIKDLETGKQVAIEYIEAVIDKHTSIKEEE